MTKKHHDPDTVGLEPYGNHWCSFISIVLLVVFISVHSWGCRKSSEQDSSLINSPRLFLEPSSFKGANALAEVEALVHLGPRIAGTDGSKKAALHIAERLGACRLKPEIVEFEENTVEGRKTFRNVVARFGSESPKLVVLAAHYDTKTGISDNFQGANDSGSGVGLLIELARCLSEAALTNRYNIELAFLDGEECVREYGARDGLHGSRRHAKSLVDRVDDKRVIAVIVVDMTGDRDLTVTIPRNSTPMLIAYAFEAAKEENIRNKFSLFNGTILDDHVPYLSSGMPAIDLIDFEYGSIPGKNDYWHTPHDTLDKISSDSLEMVGRVVIRMLNKLAESQD